MLHHLAYLTVAAQLVTASSGMLLKEGQKAPPFTLRDLERSMFSLKSHVGDSPETPRKAVMMVFFATWCKPCMKEIPIIKRIHQKWKTHQVEVIYIGFAQKAKLLKPFAAEHKMPWRVLPDSFGLVSRRYGASELPHVVIIDGARNIAFQHRGIAANLEGMIDKQLAGITGVTPTTQQTTSATVSKPRFDLDYRFGRAPSSKRAPSLWEPLAVYLGEAAKARIEMSTEKSYEAFEKALLTGKYELVNAGPLLYHSVRQVYEPLIRLERQGTPHYLGIIFTARSSGIRSIADLTGKTIGLVSEKSTSGGLYPQLTLLRNKLVPGKSITIKWLGSHSAVAKAVKEGTVDAGGCYEDCRDAAWQTLSAKAAATRILAYTEEIPAEMILVKRSLPQKTKDALRKAMSHVSAELLMQISQGEPTITGAFPPSKADLKQLEKVVNCVTQKRTCK